MYGTTSQETPKLRFYRGLEAQAIGARASLRPRDAAMFDGPGIARAFARELCERSALPVKELFEAAEVFALARKKLRAETIVDACAGHGLAGLFFALMERDVKKVVLVDRVRPESADGLLDAADAVAPWVRPKVEWQVERLDRAVVPGKASVVAIHACGLRTDLALDLARRADGAFAALPCCRPHRKHPAPEGLKLALGSDTAIDVHRSYELERAGYRVRWHAIHPAITPMNRLIVAARPG